MRWLAKLLILLTLPFYMLNADEILTKDDRSFKLKIHTFGWKTNWNKHTINYKELLSGGPSRDGIPPLDKPSFETIHSAKNWLEKREPVIFVTLNDEVKIYPLQILIWHEIVNDSLGGKEIAVTFCPLCNASIVFDRNLEGKLYDFGTSGLLRHSDLVMYDRQTESLWQQFTGKAIVGDLVNKTLLQLPSSIMSFENVMKHYPNAQVLSKNTGYIREYGKNPYLGYDDIDQNPFMLKQTPDGRLAPMERVATLSLANSDKAYAYRTLKKQKVVNDSFKNEKVVLFYGNNVASALNETNIAMSKDSGTVVIYDRSVGDKTLTFYEKEGVFYDNQTHSTWNIFGKAIAGKFKGTQLNQKVFGSHFWFAWAVFKPNTLIYK